MAESVTFQVSKGTAAVMTVFFLAVAALLGGSVSSAQGIGIGSRHSACRRSPPTTPSRYSSPVYLRLDEDGPEISSRIRKTVHIKWTEMQELRLDHGETTTIRIVYWKADAGQRERSIDGEYTTSLEEILWTLDKWRERYGTPR